MISNIIEAIIAVLLALVAIACLGVFALFAHSISKSGLAGATAIDLIFIMMPLLIGVVALGFTGTMAVARRQRTP